MAVATTLISQSRNSQKVKISIHWILYRNDELFRLEQLLYDLKQQSCSNAKEVSKDVLLYGNNVLIKIIWQRMKAFLDLLLIFVELGVLAICG
jgi:hypothetical protein